jgi:hypothetical protein
MRSETEAGVEIPILPVEGVVLVTAFGRRSKRIRRQALLEFEIGQDVFETILLVSPRLNNDSRGRMELPLTSTQESSPMSMEV